MKAWKTREDIPLDEEETCELDFFLQGLSRSSER